MEKGKDKKDRVLIIGATGHIGRRLVKASLGLGHPTFLLFRPANASDFNKCQLFMEFKMQGARLLPVRVCIQTKIINFGHLFRIHIYGSNDV